MNGFREVELQAEYFTDHRTKCKCGHSVLITNKNGRKLCKWCNRFVFATPELKKEYQLKEIKYRLGEYKNE